MKKEFILEPDTGDVFHVTGTSSVSAKSFLLSRLRSPRLNDGRVLWYVGNLAEGQILASLLTAWLKEAGYDRKVRLFGRDNVSLCLWELIEGTDSFLIIPVEYLAHPFVKPELFKKQALQLTKNDITSPAQLSHELVLIGYDFNVTADAPGTFSRRGNIVDIFPPDTSWPYRIEFGHSTIENIYIIESASNKTQRLLREAFILPARIDQTATESSLRDYLDLAFKCQNIHIYSDPDDIARSSSQWSGIEKEISAQPRIIFHTLPGRRQHQNIFDFAAAPLFHKNINAFLDQLAIWQNQHWNIYSPKNLAHDIERLWKKERNEQAPLTVKYIDLSPLLTPELGFISAQEKTVLITEYELYGRSERTNIKPPSHRRAKRLDVSFIAELTPGDYVVHLDHGIGRFKGLATHTIDGITKEYFQLEYAANDKLSVPIELAYKIDKYIGSDSPIVHRLSNSTWHQLKRRIKIETKKIADELLKLYAERQNARTEPCKRMTQAEVELGKSFKYQETPDQMRAIVDVNEDLENARPMDRLVCGDVGFGKTEVAIRAAFKVVMNKRQVAILAPTTILAQQHYDTFVQRLKNFPVAIESLSRFKTAAQQKESVAKLKTGEIDIIIGTHRLLSKDVDFKNLGLIIVDEEQRFGVRHKEKLKSIRVSTPVLTMSATPIPRTLNLALAALRDMSVIRTPPEGRQPIETALAPFSDETVKEALMFELRRGGQAYYLHNRVETINLAASKIKKLIPEANIGIVHGRLPENELAKTMSEFDLNETNILVATSIIENGLDLPNVNTLVVEDATRFGLAQLYQLRGRIGRGQRQAFSYFLYPQRKVTGEAKKRLQALMEAKELGSGFQVAMRDLEIRGVGNILGREQHGRVNAVGLSLYLRLVNQAVTELETGQPVKVLRDIMMDMPVAITIPTDYINNEKQRLQAYRELTEIADIDQLEVHFQDLAKRYGELPPNVLNLKQLLRLKIIAQDTKIDGIETVQRTEYGVPTNRLLIKFSETYTPPQIKSLLDMNPDWVLGENQIKIDLAKLPQPWLERLEKVIKIFRVKPEPIDEDEEE
ncbi:MAG: transcription-repair coupling factor [Patescibacteria group bacterium]|jgi:transcription-repair coupling factor (superfamily II helicase)